MRKRGQVCLKWCVYVCVRGPPAPLLHPPTPHPCSWLWGEGGGKEVDRAKLFPSGGFCCSFFFKRPFGSFPQERNNNTVMKKTDSPRLCGHLVSPPTLHSQTHFAFPVLHYVFARCNWWGRAGEAFLLRNQTPPPPAPSSIITRRFATRKRGC